MNKESIAAKIVAQGELILDAPMLIGSGGSDDSKDQKDIHVLRNKAGIPYIPGTSLAGVLRDFIEADDPKIGELLFGTSKETENSNNEMQSAISFYDVKLSNADTIVRDGVSIDAVTGVAMAHHKFDYEAVDSGAHGILQIEITLRGIHAEIKENVNAALARLRDRLLGGFYLGAYTTKGLGRVHLKNLIIDYYDFTKPQDVLSWLKPKRGQAEQHHEYKGNTGKRVYAASDFVVDAEFALTHSLIVRDYDKMARDVATSGETSISAIMKTDSRGNYIIPGTSLKGVLRHRAEYILNKLGKDIKLVELMMGPSPKTMKLNPNEAKKRSRFRVDETAIKSGVVSKEQSRNRIDRFTGGTINTALFTTKPVWQQQPAEPVLKLHFAVTKATEWEAGLTLLLLKDLWLGRIAIGGEKSIGRGTLAGISAAISYQGKKWQLHKQESLNEAEAGELQQFVTALAEGEEL